MGTIENTDNKVVDKWESSHVAGGIENILTLWKTVNVLRETQKRIPHKTT